MGEHKGWLVGLQGKAHVARAWDPGAGKYRSKSFDKESLAKKWAMDQAAAFRMKLDAASAPSTRNLVRDFLMDRERLGRSAGHLNDMRHVLDQFAAKVSDLSHPRVATITEEWLSGLSDLSPATRNRYLVTCKTLCRWAVKRGRLTRDPLGVVEREQVPARLKAQFTIDELRRLVGRAGDHYHPMFILMLYTGLRIDEAAHLRWQDVDLDGRTILVTWDSGANVKRDKEREVRVQSELAAFLAAIRPPYAVGAIFGHVGAHRGLRFSRYLKRCGIEPGRRTPHSLRHCYAGLMTATGINSGILRQGMGHTADSTTAGYAKSASKHAPVVEAEGWPRGQFQLMQGMATAWRSPWPRQPQ